MKTLYKFSVFAFILFAVYFSDSKPQESIFIFNNYDSLYNVIKSGQAVSINKTAWLDEFSLIEKSLITITPQSSPETGYGVIIKILKLSKGSYDTAFENNSILGYLISGCEGVSSKFSMLSNTSCSFIADNPEDAIKAAKLGITNEIDSKYLMEGSLATAYKKICDANYRPQPVKKPAVYLYPSETMNIDVKVKVNGHLTFTEPLYNTGWNVNVTPDGLIDNKYDYLFYEANLNKIELPDEGWVVEYEKLDSWFDDYLPKLGLNEKEKNQFKEYWLNNLRKVKYYEIRLLDDKFLSENMKLIINPEPQTLIRLNFHFKPVFSKTELKTPVINTPVRNGFTVIEWGGINEGDLKITP